MGRIRAMLTYDQGQWLLGQSMSFQLPERLGDLGPWTAQTRADVREECRALYHALKEVSPWCQKQGRAYRMMFGAPSNWTQTRVKGEDGAEDDGYELNDPALDAEVRLGEDSVSAIMWIVSILMHPTLRGQDGKVLHQSVSTQVADRIIWPVVEKVRRTGALREALGLDKAPKRRWNEDSEPKPSMAEVSSE